MTRLNAIGSAALAGENAYNFATEISETPKSRLRPCDSVRNVNSVVLALYHAFAYHVCSVVKNDYVLFIKFSRFKNLLTFHPLGLRMLAKAGVGSSIKFYFIKFQLLGDVLVRNKGCHRS